MSKKNRQIEGDIEETLNSAFDRILEDAGQDDPVIEEKIEPVKVAVEEVVVKPVKEVKAKVLIPITEVARQYRQYKKYHDASILTFCKSTGLPTIGSQIEMKNVLAKFGW
jgi:hypothetical protein